MRCDKGNPVVRRVNAKLRASFKEEIAGLPNRRGWTVIKGCLAAIKKRRGQAYSWFLNRLVPVVLAVLWLMGVTLIGLCALVLYLYWLLLS